MSPPPPRPAVAARTSASQADALAESIKRRWRDGERPDAAAVLAEYPSLIAFRSLVVELAYEEFCLREQREEAPDPDEFCTRIAAYQQSVRRVLQAHLFLAAHPEVLEPDAVPWPKPGSRIDGLTVVGELGRGAFARAYLVFDPETDRLCVLKLSATLAGEGRALGRLKHPHVTEVYWARRIGGLNAVCMPLLGLTTLEKARQAAFRGQPAGPATADVLLDAIATDPHAADLPANAAAVVRRGEPFARGVAAIAARIASALAYLHELGAAHGDLKSSNVVLGPGAHPYLIDFNLAVPGDDPTAVRGTVPYMAPERLRALVAGSPTPAEPARADVYSFGVLLFELLTGWPPWLPAGSDPKAGAAELLAKRAADPVPWPPGMALSAPIARLVEQCLADDPQARPAAAELATALERWLQIERGEWSKRRRLLLAIGLALLVVIPLTWLAIAAWDEAPPQQSEPTNSTESARSLPPPGVPQTAAEFFARGRATMRQNPHAALADFRRVGKFKKVETPELKPRAVACEAYCIARFNLESGIDRAQNAIEMGVKTGAVYNIVGYCYLQSGKSECREEAMRALDEAVRLSPELIPARYNRALARLQSRTGPRLPDRVAAEDIERVLANPNQPAEVYLYAARIFAASAHLDAQYRYKAVGCLNEAIRLKANPTMIGRDPDLLKYLDLNQPLQSDPRFTKACDGQKIPCPPKTTIDLRLAEPE